MKALWRNLPTSSNVSHKGYIMPRKRRMMNQINVVPYIDVMLVLLIIFMVTAPMTNPGVVDLPSVGQALKQTAAPNVVTIAKDGSLKLNNEAITRDELLFKIKKLAQADKNANSVLVAGDEKTPYGKVIEIMDMLKQNKVEKVGLLLKSQK